MLSRKLVTKLFSSLTRNDEMKKDFWVQSRNFASHKSIKDPLSSTQHIKVQDENQNSNRKETKPLPTLKLLINPNSKELQLQVNDNKPFNESETSSSNQQRTGFCTICNMTPCKFQNSSNDNNVSGEGSSNMVIITVSKNELCRTICKDSGNVSPTSSTQNVDRDGEYCPLCDAPKCKLDNNSENNNEVNKEENRSIEKKTLKTSHASDLIQIKVNKTEICRQFCYDESAGSSTTQDTLSSSTSDNKDVDITKSPGYCNVCKSPICKYEPKSKINENQRAKEYPTSISSSSDSSSDNSSDSSDTITILVDKSEICGVICKEDKALTKTGHTKNDDKPKDYCPMCDAPKCKLLNDTPQETSSKKSRKNNVSFNSTDSTDNSTGRQNV